MVYCSRSCSRLRLASDDFKIRNFDIDRRLPFDVHALPPVAFLPPGADAIDMLQAGAAHGWPFVSQRFIAAFIQASHALASAPDSDGGGISFLSASLPARSYSARTLAGTIPSSTIASMVPCATKCGATVMMHPRLRWCAALSRRPVACSRKIFARRGSSRDNGADHQHYAMANRDGHHRGACGKIATRVRRPSQYARA